MRVDKTTGQDEVVMVDYVSMNSYSQFRSSLATGLRVYGRDNNSPNACSNNNGGCQHLCLPNGVNTKSCACTTGFQLNDDGTTCSSKNWFRYFLILFRPIMPRILVCVGGGGGVGSFVQQQVDANIFTFPVDWTLSAVPGF